MGALGKRSSQFGSDLPVQGGDRVWIMPFGSFRQHLEAHSRVERAGTLRGCWLLQWQAIRSPRSDREIRGTWPNGGRTTKLFPRAEQTVKTAEQLAEADWFLTVYLRNCRSCCTPSAGIRSGCCFSSVNTDGQGALSASA